MFLEEFADHLFEVFGLLTGIIDETSAVEIFAGTELHGLFAERAPQCLRHIIRLVVDDIIKGRTGEVSQQNSL